MAEINWIDGLPSPGGAGWTEATWLDGLPLPDVGAAAAPPAIQLEATLTATGDVAASLTTAIKLAAALTASGDMTGNIIASIHLVALLSADGDVTAPVLTTAIKLAAAMSASGNVTPPFLRIPILLNASLTASGVMTGVFLPSRLWSYGFDLAGIESESVNAYQIPALSSGHGRRSAVTASRWRNGRGYLIQRPTTAQGLRASLTGVTRPSGWEQFYVRVHRTPITGELRLWAAVSDQSTADPDVYVNLTTTGYLKLYDGSTGMLGLSLNPLIEHVWYRIGVYHEWRSSTASGRVRLFVDGVEQFDVTGLTTGFMGVVGARWHYSYLSQYSAGATPHYADGELDIDDWTATPINAVEAGRIDTLLPAAQGYYNAWTSGFNSWKVLVRHPDTGQTTPDIARTCTTSAAKTTVAVSMLGVVGGVRSLKIVADGSLADCDLLLRVDGVNIVYPFSMCVWDASAQLLMTSIADPGLTSASVVEIGVQKDATATARSLRGLWAIVDYAKPDAAQDSAGATKYCTCTSYTGNGTVQDVPLLFDVHLLWVFGSNGKKYFWHDGMGRVAGLQYDAVVMSSMVMNITTTGFTVAGAADSMNESGVVYFVLAVHDAAHALVLRGDTNFGSLIDGITVPLDDGLFLPEFLLLSSMQRGTV